MISVYLLLDCLFLPVFQPFCIKMHIFLKKVTEKFGGIKKNIFVILSDDTFFYLRCKDTKKDYSNQIILLFFASL